MCNLCNILICHNCVEKVLELPKEVQENQVLCNDCKNYLSIVDIQKVTRKGLDMLHVKCPSNNINCFDEYKLKDLNRHLETCKFFEGKARCNYCFLVDKTNKIKSHMETCKEMPIPCKYCEDLVERKLMLEHEETCYKKPKNCKTCKIKYEEGEIIDHLPTKDDCMLYLVKEISQKLESKNNF